MNKRGDNYYDEEADKYSQKRYPSVVQNYVQFLFTRRRDIVLECIQRVIANTSAPRSLFEMGCADGVLLRAIAEKYPNAFTTLVGSDVSEAMLSTARGLTQDPRISYAPRESLPQNGSYTCVVEIGVGALVLDTQGELEILARQLAPGGYLICSIAGRNSFAAMRGNTAANRTVLNTYEMYEVYMRKNFTIKTVRSCGIYIPLLWRVPFIGRLLQPIFELIGYLLPERAHERVYVLKKKP